MYQTLLSDDSIYSEFRCKGLLPEPHNKLMLPVYHSVGIFTSYGLTCPQCSHDVGHGTTLIGIDPLAIPIKYIIHTGLTFKIALKAGKYTLYGSFITDNIDKFTGEELLRKLLGEVFSTGNCDCQNVWSRTSPNFSC